MPQFTDSHGDGWPLNITLGTVLRVNDLLDVDLAQPLSGDPPLLTRLSTDLIFTCNLLYAICKPLAETRGITDVQFAERLSGDAFQAAHGALLGGLEDFFRQLRRPDVVAAITRQVEVVTRAVDLAEKTIASDEFSDRIDRELAKISGSLSGGWPGSSDLIPGPSHSAS